MSPAVIERVFRPGAPFSAGGHRGIDLRTVPGAAVVAPCSGVVTFRGRVGGGPSTLTVECGALRATLQRIAPSVAVGQHVRLGVAVGAASDRALDLSARRPGGAYVDPAALIGAGGHRPASPVARPRGEGRGPKPVPLRPARLPASALVSPAPVGARRGTEPAAIQVQSGVAALAPASATPAPARLGRGAAFGASAAVAIVAAVALARRRRGVAGSRPARRRADLVGARR